MPKGENWSKVNTLVALSRHRRGATEIVGLTESLRIAFPRVAPFFSRIACRSAANPHRTFGAMNQTLVSGAVTPKGRDYRTFDARASWAFPLHSSARTCSGTLPSTCRAILLHREHCAPMSFPLLSRYATRNLCFVISY